MVDAIEPTSPARGRNGLQVGDVVVSIDGESVAGLYLEDVLEVVGKSKPRYAVGVIRRKGSIPLSGAVRVAPCKSVLQRINARASALEIVLPATKPKGGKGPAAKDRYVLIAASLLEAASWMRAIDARCTDNDYVEGSLSSVARTTGRLPGAPPPSRQPTGEREPTVSPGASP